jgi:tetratricopeptide (TPR) repeat protein
MRVNDQPRPCSRQASVEPSRLRKGSTTRQSFSVGCKLPTLTAVLWVIAFTVVGAALGLLIAGPMGTVIGAIPLALGTVLAGYVPAIREAAQRRRAAQQGWDAIGEPAAETVDRGPAALLRPDREVVQFTGRETELRVLRMWCASANVRSVRIIVGAGGVGKTRLALKVASEWESRGYEWRRVDTGQEAQAVAAARGVTSGPVLLLVDYAETRSNLEAMLRAVLADPGSIRVLLVARSLGEWWDRLIEKSAPAVWGLLNEARPIRLDKPINEDTSDSELVRAAIPCFARALGVPIPRRPEFELPTTRVPVLVLHTAALVAVLRFTMRPVTSLRVLVADGLLDELLTHEARYWRRTAAAAGLPEDGGLLKPVVAAAALLGAESLAEAADVVVRVPELADAPLASRRAWARWLYGLYPSEADGRLGSLQPDLLAERHVVQQLAADRDLALRCLRDLPPQQAEQALTVLARAWAHQGPAESIIASALQSDLIHLAIPAVEVTLQTQSSLGPLLAAALQDVPVPLGALIGIADSMPFPSVALAEAHLAAVQRVQEALPRDTEPTAMARWSDRAGTLLSQLGRPTDGLAATQQAVAIWRKLAAASPGLYDADLAFSLNSLGIQFRALGRSANGLSHIQEAVAIYRELPRIIPGRDSDLARSLTNLAILFMDLGRPAEALPPAQEALAILRTLATASPDQYRPDLAKTLQNLAGVLSEMGRPIDALAVTQEAVAMYRELATASPDQYRPDLAGALVNLGALRSAAGRPEEGLRPIQEAVTIFRELATSSPRRYRPDLAASLIHLGILLSDLTRPVDALPPSLEAMAIYQELASDSPDRYQTDLARSLAIVGRSFLELGSPADALTPTQDAVAIRRELVKVSPDRYRPGLAASLNTLGLALANLGQFADALQPTQEAVAIYRELAQVSPELHRADLAGELGNLGLWFIMLGHPDDALPPSEESVAIYRELAGVSPRRHRPDLSRALDSLATVFSALQREADAQAARDEAGANRGDS